jgi:hypothetical protein
VKLIRIASRATSASRDSASTSASASASVEVAHCQIKLAGSIAGHVELGPALGERHQGIARIHQPLVMHAVVGNISVKRGHEFAFSRRAQ